MANFDIKPVVAQWLRNKGKSVYDVISFVEELYTGGYCETCYYEEWNVEITYHDNNGGLNIQTYVYEGKFSNLILELEDVNLEDINS